MGKMLISPIHTKFLLFTPKSCTSQCCRNYSDEGIHWDAWEVCCVCLEALFRLLLVFHNKKINANSIFIGICFHTPLWKLYTYSLTFKYRAPFAARVVRTRSFDLISEVSQWINSVPHIYIYVYMNRIGHPRNKCKGGNEYTYYVTYEKVLLRYREACGGHQRWSRFYGFTAFG